MISYSHDFELYVQGESSCLLINSVSMISRYPFPLSLEYVFLLSPLCYPLCKLKVKHCHLNIRMFSTFNSKVLVPRKSIKQSKFSNFSYLYNYQCLWNVSPLITTLPWSLWIEFSSLWQTVKKEHEEASIPNSSFTVLERLKTNTLNRPHLLLN